MTETRPDFDPRYDPRFQRGWVEPEPGQQASADTVHERVDTTERPSGEHDQVVPTFEAVLFAEPSEARPAAGSHARRASAAMPDPGAAPIDEPPAAAPAPPPQAASDPDVAPSSTPGLPEVRVAGFEPGDHVPVEASDLVPPAAVRRVAARWLWIVLAVSLALAVGGGIAYWQTLTSSPSPYFGGVAPDQQATWMIVSAVAPAAVEVGVIGVVASLVGWGVLGTATGRSATGGRP